MNNDDFYHQITKLRAKLNSMWSKQALLRKQMNDIQADIMETSDKLHALYEQFKPTRPTR